MSKEIKYFFHHKEFIDYVTSYYKDLDFKNNGYHITKTHIDHIISGRPTDTCTFILICNEMNINPKRFFSTNE